MGGAARQVVELVDDQDDWTRGASQLRGDFLVDRIRPFLPVHHEDHEVRLLHRELHLHPDGDIHGVRRTGHQPPGVDQPEVTSPPFGLAKMAIPCRARFIGNDRIATTEEPIEQRGLADVGPPDDRDSGLAHERSGVSSASVKQ